MSASRVDGTDAAEFQGVEVEAKNVGSDWRKKREQFVATLRAARRDARMIKKGVKLQKKLQMIFNKVLGNFLLLLKLSGQKCR